jgi:hypothetical protein
VAVARNTSNGALPSATWGPWPLGSGTDFLSAVDSPSPLHGPRRRSLSSGVGYWLDGLSRGDGGAWRGGRCGDRSNRIVYPCSSHRPGSHSLRRELRQHPAPTPRLGVTLGRSRHAGRALLPLGARSCSVMDPLRTPVDRGGSIPQSGRRTSRPAARDLPLLPTCITMHRRSPAELPDVCRVECV